jgi:transcription antitermination factor NusG
VGNRSGPLSVTESTIDSLKIMVNTEETIVTGTRFKRGDKIMVVAGPFAGVIGQFVQYRGQGRVIVNIEALGQFAAVNVDEDDVEPLPEILA